MEKTPTDTTIYEGMSFPCNVYINFLEMIIGLECIKHKNCEALSCKVTNKPPDDENLFENCRQ